MSNFRLSPLTEEQIKELIINKANWSRAADFAIERGEGSKTVSTVLRLLTESFHDGFELALKLDRENIEKCLEFFDKVKKR